MLLQIIRTDGTQRFARVGYPPLQKQVKKEESRAQQRSDTEEKTTYIDKRPLDKQSGRDG
jgi:hypothetical protein